MKFKVHSEWTLRKKSKRGFRGYPVATVAFYGPTNEFASKVAVGILESEGAEARVARWFSEDGKDVRFDAALGLEISKFVQQEGALSVVMTDRIIGCPHEEGVDYPDDTACPHCPYWAGRDRFTHELTD